MKLKNIKNPLKKKKSTKSKKILKKNALKKNLQ